MKILKKKIDNLNNQEIFSINIVNDNNFEICFYNYGGYIKNIFIPYKKNRNEREDVILGYKNLAESYRSHGYFNSIIGRVCNRIGKSKFSINDRKYNLFSNTPPDHLHGGREGFNKKVWQIKKIKEGKNFVSCTLEYFSPHLEENYPGNLKCKTVYSLNNDDELQINFQAVTDRKTIVNITNHNYWNFHGHKNYLQNISEHQVQIKSSEICEINKDYIPTGNLISVKKTKFDLNNFYNISNDFLKNGGIDHNYVIDNITLEHPIAKAFSELSGMGVEYYTDQKGIQFYTGNMMDDRYEGKYNKIYKKNYGMCFEPQNFPDAINHNNFPSPIINSQDIYESTIKIKLRNDFI